MIPVYRPFFKSDSFDYAIEAMKSSWISSQGKFYDLVSEKIKNIFGFKYVLMTSNGTAACHFLSLSLKYKYPEIKNIIVPNATFVAGINAFLLDKEFKLHAIDCDINTWNMDLNQLDSKIKYLESAGEKVAILIIHNIGNIINVPQLQRKYPNAIFLEDNCEGNLGSYEGKYSGTSSLCCAVSSYGNKCLTSGEGGWYATNDKDIYDYCYKLHNQGQSSKRFVHDLLGYNYKCTNVVAGIYLKQLELMPEIIQMKNKIFSKYKEEMHNIEGIYNQESDSNTINANWMFGFRIDSVLAINFDHADSFFKKNGIEIRPFFYPFSSHSYLLDNPLIDIGTEEVAKELNRCCIILPSYPELTEKEQAYIIQVIKEYIDTLQA